MKDNDDCCGHIKCEEGEGHCKNDDQCAGDLVCGKDNCPAPFYSHQDCCMKPTTGTTFRWSDNNNRIPFLTPITYMYIVLKVILDIFWH